MAQKQSGKKEAFSAKELEEFRILIEEKRKKATEQLDYYIAQLTDTGDSADAKIRGLDDGVSSVETERLQTMASRQKKHIQHLDNALLRIQAGTYGICRVTGKLISKERLRAVPHATLSISAKQEN